MLRSLQSINWINVSKEHNNINSFLKNFYSILQENINLYIPKFVKKESNFPNSYNLKHKIKQKRKMHYFTKVYNSPIFDESFQQLRSECKYIQATNYNTMISSLNSNLNNDPKKVWNFINNNQKNYPKEFIFNNQKSNDQDTIVEMFANNFSSVYSNKQLSNYRLDVHNKEQLDDFEIAKKNISQGPDMINHMLSNSCINELSEPLIILYNIE